MIAERDLNILTSLGGWVWAKRKANRQLSRVWDGETGTGCPLSVFQGRAVSRRPRDINS